MSHINCKLFKVFSDIIIELIKASVPGFLKIGINNLPKKNFERKIFFSDWFIFGNFCSIINEIILHSNLIESDITTSQIKNNENISYEMINTYEDYDEYYEDFMNNPFTTKKIFNNLNFCRPERFSLKKNY